MVESLVKYLIIAVLGMVIVSLATAYRQMTLGGAGARKAAQALTLRVGLSIALVVFLVVAAHLGWVRPHGLNALPIAPPKAAP